MNKVFYTLSIVLFTLVSVQAQNTEQQLERKLFNLPGVSFEKISKSCETPLIYRLFVQQPLDHQHPEKGSFYQQVLLSHHGFDRPTVMNTQGYQMHLGKNEIEAIFDANYLNIEHRYFGKSVPDSIQWEFLTLEQVTADLHHINQLFRQIYSGEWISTGISKGGQTTIFYRYFYPNDVTVSIPYVAPFNNSLEDKRIYAFLDTIGSDATRKKIYDFQVYLLKNEKEACEKLYWFTKGAELKFNYLGSLEKAFEFAVLEYPFSFWQWGAKEADIPENEDLDQYLEHLLAVSDLGFFSDRDMERYAPHYYQAATQMGYYGYDISRFKDYLTQFKTNPLASFSPIKDKTPKYDNSLNEKAAKWLDKDGNNILYIYGGFDTWSADRITPSAKVNSRSFILPGKDHGQARIRNMSDVMKKDLEATLESWLGIKPDTSKL
jgi:hypothetical protein